MNPTLLRTCALLAAAFLAAIAPASAGARAIHKPKWVRGVGVTEYFPIPEKWFVGKPVPAPGLSGTHRVDWLYSAQGLSMEGDGVGLDGKHYHIESVGDGGWVNAKAKPTSASRHAGNWSNGRPFWRSGGFWRNRGHAVTFPLDAGGWFSGTGLHYVPLHGISFGSGTSVPGLEYYKSLAVDPKLIPLGSRVYIPAYKDTAGGGWFRAMDTGGAIIGRHVDVYRSAPSDPSDGGQFLQHQRIYVVPPGTTSPKAPAGGGGGGGQPSTGNG